MNQFEQYQLKQDPEAGYYYVWPTPDVATLRQLYSHDYYQRDKPVYLDKTAAEIEYWHAIWAPRLDVLGRRDGKPGSILDIGASGGFFLDFARTRGWKVAGVEPSRQSTAWAREHFGLNLFEGYLEDYQQADESFDAIHMALVLEHVRSPRDFLAQALRLLKPGGTIWLEAPNDFNRFQEVIVAALNKPRWWIVPGHHLNYFDFKSLQKLLISLGAAPITQQGSFPMELFVLMGMDYIGDDAVGAQAHSFRMNFEKNMLAYDPAALVRFYRALADAGLGRTCNILAVKS